MPNLEFKPNLFAPVRVFFFLISLAIPFYSLFVLFPKVLALSQYPEVADTFTRFYFMIGFSCLLPLIVLALLIVPLLSKKIRIEGELMYIFDKSLFGSQTMKIVHLKDVKKISEEIKKVWSGKVMMVFYLWVLHLQDGKTDKIHLTGWDKDTLKKILSHIKGKYSNILFDTSIYRDSSERLSGIEEFLKR